MLIQPNFTKLRHGKKWYTHADSDKVVIPLRRIVHPKLNFYELDAVDELP